MAVPALLKQRLLNQHLANSKLSTPQQVVEAMVAMQAQEYAQAKWAIGLRLPGSTESQVEEAFTKGGILRTHVMRPTWHFVAPKDIRWLLKLTAPRIHAISRYYYKKEELDGKLLKKCNDIIQKELEGGRYQTRNALNIALANKKIIASGHRLSYIFVQAEIEGLICSGPRQGKQFTYALIDERVPAAKPMSRDESLAMLMKRYLESRGAATLYDFAMWSGLTLTDAKRAITLLDEKPDESKIDGDTCYFFNDGAAFKSTFQRTFLMPDYDEYGMSYKNRTMLLPEGHMPVFPGDHMVIVDGRFGGKWSRLVKGQRHAAKVSLYQHLSPQQVNDVKKSVKRYEQFMNA